MGTNRLVHNTQMGTTREQIVDAASRLIHLRGFNNTSVEDILRQTGIGKGNFYYYFKSKDELGFAALDRNLERIQEALIRKSFLPGKDPWRQLDTFLDLLVDVARQNGCSGGCPLGNLAVEMSDIHEEFRRRIGQAFDRLCASIESALAEAKAQGTLRSEADIPRLARFILAGVEGALMLGKLHRSPALMAGVIQELKGHLAQYRVA